jgi:hypothetical protein
VSSEYLCGIPTAVNSEFFQEVMECVAAMPPPAASGQFFKKLIKLLVTICKVLQQAAGKGRAFYLDCRTAGELIGVDFKTAWSWLRLLCRRGVLKLVKAGSQADGRANEYRYVGD